MILIHIIDNQLKSSSLKLALKPPPWEGLHFASCNKHRHRSLESRTVHLDLRSNLPARDSREGGTLHKHRPLVFFAICLSMFVSMSHSFHSFKICDKHRQTSFSFLLQVTTRYELQDDPSGFHSGSGAPPGRCPTLRADATRHSAPGATRELRPPGRCLGLGVVFFHELPEMGG